MEVETAAGTLVDAEQLAAVTEVEDVLALGLSGLVDN
jgi:hypothetical protein